MKKGLALILALGMTAAAGGHASAQVTNVLTRSGHHDNHDDNGKVVNNDYSKTKNINNDNRKYKTVNNQYESNKTLNYDDSNKAYGGQGGKGGNGLGIGQGGKGGNSDVRNSGNSNNTNRNTNKAFGGQGGFGVGEGGNANANSNSNAAASANGGGNGNNVNVSEVYESDIFDAQYIAPNQYLPNTTGYSFGINNKMGSLQIGCPVESKQFSVGAWLGGIGYGKNSDDLPEDCEKGAGLIKTSYYDNLMFHGVEDLDHFDQIHARCVAVAEAYKHNYGRTKSVSACVQAMTKTKKIKKHVLPPLPPMKKPIMKPAPLPQPMPMPMPKPQLPDDAEKNG